MEQEVIIDTKNEVYAPAEDTYLIIDMLLSYLKSSKKSNISLLDIGTGTGIISITSTRSKKITKLTLSDINPEAVSLAKKNLENNVDLLKNIKTEVIQSDLFNNVHKVKYDIITFNPPYLPMEENSKILNEAFFGGWSGIEITQKFLKTSLEYLSEDGVIFIVSSSLADINKLISYIKEVGLIIKNQEKVHIFFEDIICFELHLKNNNG
ncbi:MAG: methyltransferase [Candidatus Micrarchaeaceae archaeon]